MPPYPEDRLPGGEKRSPLGLPFRVGDADHTKTNQIWSKVRNNVHKARGPHRPSYLAETPNATAILPYYWEHYPSDFAKYLRQELCDHHMGNFLEDKKVLNWCPGFTKLHPLNATGDGNCLLHAISLALWGIEDTDLWLRKLLYNVMRGEYAADNEKRWRRERNCFDSMHIPGQGFRYNTKEWSAEWKIVVNISSPERRLDQTKGLPYECLEEFHIFIMANILRRPIIILAENMWRDAAGRSLQPMNFSGIYLPLAWEAKDCYRYPILLGYHQMHFSPLLCTSPSADKEVKDGYFVPLVDQDVERLPIHFLLQEEEGTETNLLQSYLTCETADISGRLSLCARLATHSRMEEFDVFESYLKLAEMRYRMYSEEQHNPVNAEALKAAGMMSAISTQQLDEKIAAAGEPKQSEHLRHVRKEEPSVQPGGSFPGNADIPTEESVCISSTALQSSGLKVAPMNLQHIGYSGRTTLSCRKPGCPYMRVVESDKYCERCYKAMSSVGKEAFKKCRVDSCLNGADRKYGGLCQVCYDQHAFMNDDAICVVQPASVQELSTSPKFSGLSARGSVHFDTGTIQDGNGMEVDDEKTSDNTLNTNVVNDFTVGSKQCITPDCVFTGNPNYDGLCSTCYKGKAGAGKKSTGGADSLGFLDSSPPLQIPVTVGKKKCLMPECELTGHPEKGDLCSGCFSKQAEISEAAGLPLNAVGEKPSSIPDVHIPEFSRGLSTERQKQLMEGLAQPCRTPNCEMYALPSQNGFCSKCYKKSTAGKSSPLDFNRGSHSPQRKHARDQEVSTFRPILQFTVQKNMCAIPGCNGVRLRLGPGDLCRAHYHESAKRYSPTTSTPTPPGVITRTGMPSVGGRVQPSAPPQSIYASQPGSRPTGMSNIAMQHPAKSVSVARSPSMEICAHPKCNNPAVAPTFVACTSCQDFVDKVNQLQAALRSVRGAGATAVSSPVWLPPSDDEMSPMAIEAEIDQYDPPTETVRNLDIHEKPSSGIKGKFQYDYIKRVRCRAKGGCPNGSFGNPEYGDLCAKCFDRYVVQIHNTSKSSSAPLKKSSRSHTLPPRSQSAVIAGTSTASRAVPRPSNYRKCCSRDCENQANVQIMEGFCNDCYPAYKSREAKRRSLSSSGVRDPSAPSSGVSKREKPIIVEDDPFKPSALKCKTATCSNYGNSQSRGYCNGCFRKIMKP